MKQLLIEKSRKDLIDKSKKSDQYKDTSKGKNRWERRNHSRIAASVADYNKIDMNAFWKGDILEFGINIHGETDDYVVTVIFEHILDEIRQQVKLNNMKLEFKCILKALVKVFNSDDVYIHCTCLHPDTQIKLLDGTTCSVKEMCERYNNGEKLWVYSTDSNGDFKPGEVEKVWVTKKEKSLIKITLDNGKEITTTLDHPYMMRNGSYKLAQHLTVGDSLMPLYFNNSNGYETVKLNSEARNWKSVYKLIAEELNHDEIIEAEERAKTQESCLDYLVAIHHKDFNKKNNHPDNLKVMTAQEHWDYHNSLTFANKPVEVQEHIREASRQTANKINANPTERMLECREAFIKKGHELAKFRNHDQECLEQQAKLMSEVMSAFYESLTEEEKAELSIKRSEQIKTAWAKGCYDTEAFKEAAKKRGQEMHTAKMEALSAEGVRNYYKNLSPEQLQARKEISANNIRKASGKIKGVALTTEHKNKISEARLNRSAEDIKAANDKIFDSKVLNILSNIINNKETLTCENYKKYWKSGYPGLAKVITKYGSFDDAVSYFNLNHKVAKIEYLTLDEPIEVYDIKVAKWENFLVDAGVVLHNCPDFTYRQDYWATQGRYNAGLPQMSNGKAIANPNDTKGGGCKHVNLVLGNLDWLMKIASVINNYIYYCKDNMENNYAEYIFPKIYGMKYDKAVQLTFNDFDDEGNLKTDLATSPDDINLANALGKRRTQFKPKGETSVNPRFRKEKTEKPENTKLRKGNNPLGIKFGDNKELVPEEEPKEEEPMEQLPTEEPTINAKSYDM